MRSKRAPGSQKSHSAGGRGVHAVFVRRGQKGDVPAAAPSARRPVRHAGREGSRVYGEWGLEAANLQENSTKLHVNGSGGDFLAVTPRGQAARADSRPESDLRPFSARGAWRLQTSGPQEQRPLGTEPSYKMTTPDVTGHKRQAEAAADGNARGCHTLCGPGVRDTWNRTARQRRT